MIEDRAPIRITVRLTPRAGRDSIDGWRGDVLCARVSAPAIDGRANEALVRLLAELLGLAASGIRIVRGKQSRTKLIEIEGLGREDVESRFGKPAGGVG